MRIIGHGIDIVELSRVAARLADPDQSWVRSVFSPEEREQAADANERTDYYAGRYAGKEAVSKALGTGFSGDVTVHTIEVLRLPNRAPCVKLTGGASKAAAALGITGWQISISHDGGIAIASAIAVGD